MNDAYNLIVSALVTGAGNSAAYVKSAQKSLREDFGWVFPDNPIKSTVNSTKDVVMLVGYKVLSTDDGVEKIEALICCDTRRFASDDIWTAFEGKVVKSAYVRMLTTGQLYYGEASHDSNTVCDYWDELKP